MKVNHIRQQTVVNQIMEAMKEFIISGKIKPGDKLPTETELAEMFGVSRSSVREAIKVFKYIGVFDSQTKNGTVLNYSSSISEEALTWSFLLGKRDMVDILDVRRIIEQEGWIDLCEAYQSGKEVAHKVIEDLKKTLEEMAIAVDKNDMATACEADFNFHKIIINFTENDILTAFFQTLKSFTFEEIHQSHDYQQRMNSISGHLVSAHKILYESIYEKDTIKTLSLFRKHIEETSFMVLKLREMNKSN